MPTSQETVHCHLRLLGPIQIERDGHPIGRLESRKALGLLCYLCSQTKPVSRNHLVSLFWGDKSEARGLGNLSRVLHSISQELPGSLESTRYSVLFRHYDRFWLDIVNFDRLLSSKKPHLLAAATELCRGDFLEDLVVKECPEFDLWLMAEREQWRQRMARLFLAVIKHHSERGEYEAGIRFSTRLLSIDPLHEEGHRQKMLLHHLSGQRAAALAQFKLYKDLLSSELGVEPSHEIRLLHRQIKEVNVALEISTYPVQQREPLLERGDEHRWLMRQWEDARRGQGKFTLVEGAAGVGKTALIDEVLAYAAGHGARILRSRCYDYQSGLTFEAVINALRPLFSSQDDILDRITLAESWLAELIRLWPEVQRHLTVVSVFPDEEENARHRLFEAIALLLEETIGHTRNVVLFLDDLHQADQPSLDLLRYLYHRLRTRSIWFVCAYCRQETTPNHPLTLFRNVLTREGHLAATLLKPLSSDTIFQILRRFDGLSTSQIRQLGHFLHEQSEGNPFVLEQICLALQEAQILVEEQGEWQVDELRLAEISLNGIEAPAAIAALQENRLARLNPRARRLLQIAAAIGRTFELSLLIHVSGEPTEWVEICLSSWMARDLVEEMNHNETTSTTWADTATKAEWQRVFSTRGRGEDRYRFSHIMLWRVVLAELSPLQRLRLDQQIAQTRQKGPTDLARQMQHSLQHVEELGD
jgi:DNA-binding SARP family transcriptional activator